MRLHKNKDSYLDGSCIRADVNKTFFYFLKYFDPNFLLENFFGTRVSWFIILAHVMKLEMLLGVYSSPCISDQGTCQLGRHDVNASVHKYCGGPPRPSFLIKLSCIHLINKYCIGLTFSFKFF